MSLGSSRFGTAHVGAESLSTTSVNAKVLFKVDQRNRRCARTQAFYGTRRLTTFLEDLRMTINRYCEEYLAAGLALTEVTGKAPKKKDWNRPENAIRHADQIPIGIEGIGLCHAFSDPPTCSIDIDDLAQASKWLAAYGIDINALLDAPDAVRIESGRPNKAKLIYRLSPESPPLPTKVIKNGVASVLEFRCATQAGLSVQDVLPPTHHPLTGEPYRWAGRGSFNRLPIIPGGLINLWMTQLSQQKPFNGVPGVTGVDLDNDTRAVAGYPETSENIEAVKTALAVLPAGCAYPDWRDVIMALKSTLWLCAKDLAREWSRTAPPGRWDESEFEKLWASAKPFGGITIRTLLFKARQATSHPSTVLPVVPSGGSATAFSIEDGQLSIPTQSPGRRQYLFGSAVTRGTLTVLAGLGGTAKTILTLELAVHAALGRALGDFQISEFSSLLFLGEETRNERDRRIGAICAHLEDTERRLVEERVAVFPAAGIDLRLTWLYDGNPVAQPLVGQIIALAREHQTRCGLPVGLIVLDHARLVMAGDPNAADDVTQLTRLLTEIAIATNASVMLITHSPKSSRQKESSADAAEVFGSTAFVDNARCAFVVNTMRPHEASEFGVPEKESGWYLCLTAAKVNYGRSGTRYWFKKDEVAGWDSIRLEPVNLFPQSLFRNHSALSKTLIENVKAKPGYYTARKLRDLAGTDGPLKASDAEVRRTLNRMIDEGQLISRAPTAMEREQYRLQSQVREVLDVADGLRGS